MLAYVISIYPQPRLAVDGMSIVSLLCQPPSRLAFAGPGVCLFRTTRQLLASTPATAPLTLSDSLGMNGCADTSLFSQAGK